MVYTCRMRANCIWRRKKCILICALLIQNDANMQMRLVNFTIFQDLVTKKEKGSVFHFIHFPTIIYNVHMFSCKIWNLVLVWTFSILTHAVIWVPFPPPICFTTSPCSYDFLLAQWKVSIAINVSNMFYCVVSLICNYYMNKNWNLPGIRTNDPPSTETRINAQISIFLKTFLTSFISWKCTSEYVFIHIPPIQNDRDRLLFIFPAPFLPKQYRN